MYFCVIINVNKMFIILHIYLLHIISVIINDFIEFFTVKKVYISLQYIFSFIKVTRNYSWLLCNNDILVNLVKIMWFFNIQQKHIYMLFSIKKLWMF